MANVYGRELPRTLFSRMIKNPIEQTLRLDASCVVVNLFRIPEEPEVTDQCIQNILDVKPECDRYGMPLTIGPFVSRTNAQAGGYLVDGDPKEILLLVRRAVELAPTSSALLNQGAAGIVCGPNVVQDRNPVAMTALMTIVNDGATAIRAAELLYQAQTRFRPVSSLAG